MEGETPGFDPEIVGAGWVAVHRARMIDGHDPPSHHVFAEIGICNRLVGLFKHRMLGLHNKVLGLSLLLNKGLFLNSFMS